MNDAKTSFPNSRHFSTVSMLDVWGEAGGTTRAFLDPDERVALPVLRALWKPESSGPTCNQVSNRVGKKHEKHINRSTRGGM